MNLKMLEFYKKILLEGKEQIVRYAQGAFININQHIQQKTNDKNDAIIFACRCFVSFTEKIGKLTETEYELLYKILGENITKEEALTSINNCCDNEIFQKIKKETSISEELLSNVCILGIAFAAWHGKISDQVEKTFDFLLDIKYKCSNCGLDVTRDNQYCPKCGAKLNFSNDKQILTEENKKIEFDEKEWRGQYKKLKIADSAFKGIVEYNQRHAITYAIQALIILIGSLVVLYCKGIKFKDIDGFYSMIDFKNMANQGYFELFNLENFALTFNLCVMFCFVGISAILIFNLLFMVSKKELLRSYLVDGVNSAVKTTYNKLVIPSIFADIFIFILFIPLFKICTLSIDVLGKKYLLVDSFPSKIILMFIIVLGVNAIFLFIAGLTWLKNSNKFFKSVRNGKIK